VWVLLVFTKIHGGPDVSAALSGRQIRSRSLEGSCPWSAAVRACLDAVHAHRHAPVGVLPTLRPDPATRNRRQTRQDLSLLSEHEGSRRAGWFVHGILALGGHVPAVVGFELSCGRRRGRLLRQTAAQSDGSPEVER